MVNPKELRIGNYVHKIDAVVRDGIIQYSKRLYEISHNDIYHIVEDSDPTNHPIPLTTEWMAKCGFDWNPEEQVYFKQIGNTAYIEYDVDFNCSVVPETWRGQPLHMWGDNKYLHKLQNIYLDLTGEELEIK